MVKAKLLLALSLLAPTLVGRAQTSPQPINSLNLSSAGVPTNGCEKGQLNTDNSTGDLYTCKDNAWIKQGGGTGAVSSVFGRTGAVTASTNDYSWTQIASKPSTFPPDAHGHIIGDTTGLQTALDGKQATLGFTPENSANKNAASGYAGLSAGSKITASQMSAVLASSDLTNDSALEKTANKNAASGYAGLTSGTKLTAAQGQEVWALSDLTDFTGKSGTGTSGIGITPTSLATNDVLKWSGTDWVNATAAPKATALAATPALCSSGQAPTGVLTNGDATGCTTITGGGSSMTRLTADTGGSATNTLVTTGMTFSLAASTTYTLDCNILFTVSATSAVGLTLGVNGPGTPTQVTLMRLMNTTATAFRLDSTAGATWAAKIGATATTVTSLSSARLTGTIENGTTAGTLDVQYANIGTTGTTVVKRGSFCRLQ